MPTFRPPPPRQSRVKLNACGDNDRHDYAVGPSAAICNRCSKVVHLGGVGRCGHTIEPLRPGVAPLTCSLPYGHLGEHQDGRGAHWSVDGQTWTPARG